ncbi:XTP/dITP diphosphatase [Candidatus Poribacteria bacterium]|nr:XTP/dITP diphosphatase [Candidatus Poribacteria bacterium]
MKLVLATRNQGKVREIGDILQDQSGIELLSLRNYPDAPDVVEDGKTYDENAIKKASTLAEYTGHLTIADDSGLEVDALDGAPGVHSARYAGENASDQDRIAKLLNALQDIPDDRRSGRFICAVAIAEPLAKVQVVRGVCEGRIIHGSRGTSGFGYDPIFVPLDYAETFAELGDEIKNQISHRAKALEKASKMLSEMIFKRC